MQTIPTIFLLLLISCLTSLSLFYHTKLYHLHSQPNTVNSPHARFVSTPNPNTPSLPSRLRSQAFRAFLAFWRFLLGIGPPNSETEERMAMDGVAGGAGAVGKVQELEVWTPEEGEKTLFCVYSPLHGLIWQTFSAGNWILVFLILGALTSTVSLPRSVVFGVYSGC